MTNLKDTDKVAIYWSEGENGKTYQYIHGRGWTNARLLNLKGNQTNYSVKDVKKFFTESEILNDYLHKGNLFVVKNDDWHNGKVKVEDLLKTASTIARVLKEANWIKKNQLTMTIEDALAKGILVGYQKWNKAKDFIVDAVKEGFTIEQPQNINKFYFAKLNDKFYGCFQQNSIKRFLFSPESSGFESSYKLFDAIADLEDNSFSKKSSHIKKASENNLTAEQQEKINAELDNSTVSFQELAHQMAPIVKAGVQDIYDYLLNEKSYWQYRHRIAGKEMKLLNPDYLALGKIEFSKLKHQDPSYKYKKYVSQQDFEVLMKEAFDSVKHKNYVIN